MARVIKGGTAQQSPQGAVAKIRAQAAGGKKVIEKEVYRAQQEGGEIVARAEAERDRILAEGKQKAAQAREEAQAEGAQEAFEEAAEEALLAFRHRAERYAEAADDIRALALEVSRKILGTNLRLPPQRIDVVIQKGLAQLRARRKLRVLVPSARRAALIRERPILMDRLATEPDLVIEPAEDVSPGRARIVTEVGGALCSEQRALDSLAEALGVDERAVAPAPQSAVIDLSSDQERLAATYDEDSGPSWEDSAEASADDSSAEQSSEEEATEFLKNAQAAKKPAARPRPVRSLGEASKKHDVDQTMALDVSQLREDLAGQDPPSDELDLFADDAVE